MTESRQSNQQLLPRLAGPILISWFLLALGGSWFGVFDSPQRPPLLIGAAAVLPVLVFAVWYFRSEALRQFVLGWDLQLITVIQTARVAGVVFVMLYLRGLLPGTFALPAGLGDIAIGATAPLVAWMITAARDFRKDIFVWWNVIGMVDLVMAVTLGVLASGAFYGSRAGAITTELMGRFPLSLVPTFFVPLYMILHIVSLSRVQSQHSVTAQLA